MATRRSWRKSRPAWPAFAFSLAAIAIAAWRLSRRYERYAVEGSSMAPTLRSGDWIIVDRAAYVRRMPRPGHIVLAHDPREPARQVVKRVVRIDFHLQAWLQGDNPAESTDSRSYGPLPPALVAGRVRWRYWPRPALVR